MYWNGIKRVGMEQSCVLEWNRVVYWNGTELCIGME